MGKAIKVLYVVGDLPWPLDCGPRLRQYHILMGLASVADVSLLAIPRETRQVPEELTGICKAVRICKRPPTIQNAGFLGKMSQLFSEFKGVPGDLNLPKLAIDTRELFGCEPEDFDCIWFERINIARLSRNLAGRTQFLDLDDLEHRKLGRSCGLAGGLLRRLRRAVEVRAWKKAEFSAIEGFGGVAVCSEEDRAYLNASNVFVIPNGAAIDPSVEFSPGVEGRMIFVGSLDYEPNDDALCYFIESILPRIAIGNPACHLQIVGRNPSSRLRAISANPTVELLGYVADVGPHLRNSAISIAPIRVGGGTRLKILESLAAKKPVVSTAVGAEGLGLIDGEHIRIADSPHSFADACIDLLSDETQRLRLADAGYRAVAERFSWGLVQARVASILGENVGKSRGDVRWALPHMD